ncbi:thymidylate synthase [Micromonospora sp. NPDC085948]|uniref:thymidylate synthase n=1 Tax=Micromonospora sp. NPDC085948 TaxID=3155293 RepID=UPI003437891F
MLHLSATSANDLYAAVCREVVRQGQRVNPRGMATTEVIGAHLILTEPRRRFVFVPPTRVLNPAFAVAEALWILSGSDDPWIFTYNRSLERYADDGRLRGAYGPRIRRWAGTIDQLDHVRNVLTRDPDSRQAVIQIYDPQQDTVGHRDVPCTLNYRFFLRDGQLHMHTTMRSNDVWLGLPYDLFTATILHELMAGWLGVKLGTYHHHVDSLHLYDQHAQNAADLVSSPVAPSPVMPALAVPAEATTEFLSAVVNGTVSTGPGSPWRDMAATLASYRQWSAGERPAARETADAIRGELGDALRGWYARLSQPAAVTGAAR